MNDRPEQKIRTFRPDRPRSVFIILDILNKILYDESRSEKCEIKNEKYMESTLESEENR